MRAVTAVTDLFEARSPLTRLFWAGVVMVACGLLAAFWSLCMQQVREAEIRQALVRMQQLALADCLQYMPRSTFASCAGALRAASTAVAVAEQATSAPGTGAVTVSVQLR